LFQELATLHLGFQGINGRKTLKSGGDVFQLFFQPMTHRIMSLCDVFYSIVIVARTDCWQTAFPTDTMLADGRLHWLFVSSSLEMTEA
jgi:hypothetical protein